MPADTHLTPDSQQRLPTPAQANAEAAPAADSPPAEISRQGNQPIVALLGSAANYVQSGELDKAGAALERALRIEPRNASIWHDLGQIRLHQRQYQQAESLASKSNSLAGNDTALRARNWRLIAVARRAMNDSAGADAAEAQAVTLER
jgi:tetratricopeptide (TPR) repeat protein